MTQHSPGPWVAYNSDNGRILKHWRIRGDCVRDDPPFATINSNGKILSEYEAANARLIAAAPELLAALKHLIAHVESCRQSWESDGSPLDTKMHGLAVCLNNRSGDLIHAAIAKATGKAVASC